MRPLPSRSACAALAPLARLGLGLAIVVGVGIAGCGTREDTQGGGDTQASDSGASTAAATGGTSGSGAATASGATSAGTGGGASTAAATTNTSSASTTSATAGSSSSMTGSSSGTTSTGTDATATASASTSDASATASTGASATAVDTDTSALPPDACDGYATRYWDCCKPHCGWTANVGPSLPVTSCDRADAPLTGNFDAPSACTNDSPSAAHTCTSSVPWAVSPTLAFGYAAVPATGDICGRCYRLEFDGTSENAPGDPGAAALAGKAMVVQATNIGYDVGGGQFDLLIPGGGVGAFDACSTQWGVTNPADLGAQYGGLLQACKQSTPGADHAALKACVRSRCEALFGPIDGGGAWPELAAGCGWFIDWYEVADNPSLRWAEVECPPALVSASGIPGRPASDLRPCAG